MLRPITIISSLLALSSHAQDTISLTNGDSFTGSLLEISEDQSIVFKFEEAEKPLHIKSGGLTRLSLKTLDTTSSSHNEKVTLINGDELPCSIKSMDDKHLNISTSYAGNFKIPRAQISKLNFDNKFQSLIYTGPKSAKEWETLETHDGWGYTSKKLTINGRGIAAQKFDIPENFILRFQFAWTGTSPKLKLHFGGREKSIEKKIDRYYLDYNSAGFQMTRSTPRRFNTLGRAELRPKDIQEKKLLIELRVDRQNNEITLYTDNRKLKSFSDNTPNSPLGEWLLFESNQSNAENIKISNLQILEWKGAELAKEEDNELIDTETDILRDSQNLRFKGSAKEIKKKGDKLTIIFDSKTSKKSLTIPSDRTSVIHFRSNSPFQLTTKIASLFILLFGLQSYAQEDKLEETLPPSSTLSFTNDNTFSGEIHSWEPGKILLSNPNLKNKTTLFTRNLLKISLSEEPASQTISPAHDHEATIFIKGRFNQEKASDQIKGQIKQITDNAITVQTNYAGELEIDRKFITNMEVQSKKSNLYAGPSDIDNWNLINSDDSWYFRNGTFISGSKSGQIAKDIGLESPAYISFNIDWKNSLYIKTLLFSDDPEDSRPSNYYELSLRNTYVSMRKYTKENGSSSMERSALRLKLQNSDTAFVEIYANSDKGVFHLYIDGEKTHTFTDRGIKKGKFGSSLHFDNDTRSPTRIRNIRASRWNGNLPTTKEVDAFTKLKGEGERILLKNGDAIIGKIGEVKEGITVVETKYSPARIPIAGLRSINMKGAFKDKHSPKMEAQDVKAYFRDGGWIILKLESIESDKMTGFHQAFGRKTFKLSAFDQVEFNIYDKQLNNERTSNIW